jgi:hypothetical protein
MVPKELEELVQGLQRDEGTQLSKWPIEPERR